MNMSQKRYTTLLQMLEGIQATISATQDDIKVLAETIDRTNEIVHVLNARLLYAGQALLGKTSLGFKTEYQQRSQFGTKFPE